MRHISYLWIWRILALAWMGTIFYLSSLSSLPTQSLFDGQDKIEHFLAYGLLGLLLVRSLQPMQVVTWKRVALITAMTVLYGISDEIHQSFVPGRDASALDILADGLGGLMAGLVSYGRIQNGWGKLMQACCPHGGLRGK